MNKLLMSAFDSLFIIIELIMMAVIISSFNKRRAKWWIITVSLFMLAIIIHKLSGLSADSQLLKICANAVLMTAWSLLCFRIGIAKCIFVVAFCIAYYNLADMAFIIIFTELVGIDVTEFVNDMYNYVSFNILVKLTELLGVVVIHVVIRHHLNNIYVGANSWVRTLIYPVSSTIVGIYMIKVVTDFPDTGFDVFVCMVVVLCADLMSIFLAGYLERQQIDVHNSAVLRASVKSELENVRAWQEAYSQQRKLTHEFNNQLAVIKGMAEHDCKTDEIVNYINQIKSLPDSSKLLVSTRRSVADVVINQKLSIARSKGIDFRVQLDDLSSIKLPDYALVVVLANILDNAIEAADKVTDSKKRKIFLKIKVVDGVTFINIENFTDRPVIIKNSKIVSTKSDKLKHGYGLINVSSIVAQYEGFYTLRYEEERGLFIVSIQI